MDASPVSDSMNLRKKRPAADGIQPLLQMERAASRALLSRLAVDASLEDETGHQPPPWIKEVSRSQNRASPGPAEDEDDRFVWLSSLARRAWHSLRPDIDIPGDDGLALAASPQPGLTGQWSLPLDGPRAPAQTLAVLAGRPEGQGTSSDRHGEAESRSRAKNAGGWPSAGMPATESMSSLPPGPPETGSPSEEGGPLASASPGEQRPDLRFGAAGSIEHADPAPEASAGIASPREARILPPLLPAQTAGATLRRTAGAAPREPKQEAAGTEDDLSALAEKIKRILDEEARRHGIDV